MLKRFAYTAASRLVLQPWFRLTRGITLGVRVAAFNGAGEVLLVRHTYAPGWLLPGGGVEAGETAARAALRELKEEASITATGALAFHGVFLNEANFRGDHIVVFSLREFTREAWSPGAEIAEARFFPLDGLPPDASGGTRRRLAEMTQGLAKAEMW